MANSSCITDWKNRILAELNENETLLEALGTTEIEREDLVKAKRIFPYQYIPDTITDVNTYIMVEISIRSTSVNNIYAYPTITFTVLCHQDDMPLEMKGVSATRADYLSVLIDDMYNGAEGFGLGRLELKSNVAGNLNEKYRFRELTFRAVDFNNGMC